MYIHSKCITDFYLHDIKTRQDIISLQQGISLYILVIYGSSTKSSNLPQKALPTDEFVSIQYDRI